MQALYIANYKVIKGTFPELAEEAKGGMLDIFKKQARIHPLRARRHRRGRSCRQRVGDTCRGRGRDAPGGFMGARAPGGSGRAQLDGSRRPRLLRGRNGHRLTVRSSEEGPAMGSSQIDPRRVLTVARCDARRLT